MARRALTAVGIDPGTRNVGFAVLGPRGEIECVALRVNGVEGALAALAERIAALPRGPQVVIGIEDYVFFGGRRNYGPINQVIGGVRALGLYFGHPVLVFSPREKEKVSKTLARPVGQTDHEFDARCIALLARQRMTQEA